MKTRSLIETGMVHWRIVLTLCAVLVAFGAYSFLTMQRQEFPDFTIRQGIVVGVMPGATSKEVEERLTKPIETYLFSFNEVNKKKTYSVSREGQVVVFVELCDQIKGQEAPAFWAKLRHGLNELKAQKLPGQTLALLGNNDFGDTSAVLFTLVAEGRSPRELQKYMEVLESNLRRIDATSKLRSYGAQDEVIHITVSRDRLARYGVRPASVWATLQGLGAAPAPARLDADELEMPVHVSRVLRTEAELGETILLSIPAGPVVRLKDVAEIKREYSHDEASVRYNGKTALVLSIEMQSGNDITAFGDQVDRAIEQTRRELPPGVTIARVADQPHVVRKSVGHFLRDFGLAIAAVILVTALLLPFRVASVAAISIPVSVAITLAVLNALGVQLQTVSLAGLIVVLGMIVDNAIVVIDDHVDRLDRGMDPWTAAWQSARGLAIPVITATVAIILSYVPMPLFVTGTAGDFLGSLPLTVAVALVTSMLVALFLVPAMNALFIRRGLHHGPERRSLLDRLQGFYDRSLEAAFRHPVLTLGVGLAAVAAALLVAAKIPQEMFPKLDRNQFAVEVYLPNGRSLKQTDAVLRRLETELLQDKRVVNVTTFVGQSSPRFHTAYAPHMPARNYGQLLVNTVDDEATLAVLREYRQRFSGAIPEGWVRWKQLELNAANPVEVRLSGTDIAELKALASQIEAHARTIPGTTWVRNDYEDALAAVDVVPDADACARLGIPPAMLQMSLALGSQGFPVGTLWEDDYPVSVVLRDDAEAAAGIEGLRQQYVSSAIGGAAVPLEQLASLRPSWSEGAIVRRNGVRTLSISVDLGEGVLSSEVQKQLERYVSTIDLGTARVEYGGEKELAAEVFTPMTVSMVVSIGLIALVLLFQFQRFRKVLATMLAMPLSLLGAFLGLVAMGYPFGMTSFMGLIGLLGIVVRNGIILVTCAEDLRREQGLGAKEAALAAGKRRMRPIYLTTMAAAVGVVPMVLSRSTLWGPLGTVTCFGLLFALVLTLFVLPVAYWLLVKGEGSGKALPSAAASVVAMGIAVLSVGTPTAAHAQESAPEATVAAPANAKGPGPAATPGTSSPAAASSPHSLEDFKQLALKHNSSVRAARLEIEAAQETRKAAFTKYFPNVSTVAVGLVAAKPLVELKNPGGNLPVYNGDLSTLPTATEFAYMPPSTINAAQRLSIFVIQAVQPVYVGGRVVNGNRLAALGEDIARYQESLARRDAVAQTEEKYWRIQVLGEKRRTLDAAMALLEGLQKEVADAERAGLITRNDRLKVVLQRSELEANQQRLDNALRLSARDLRHHVGLPDGPELVLSDPLTAPQDPTSLQVQRERGIDRRTEIRLLESAVRAERLQTDLKRGEMLPSVSVGAAALRVDVQGLGGSAFNGVFFGLASVPISGIWEGWHEVASRRRHEEQAKQKLADVRELLALEIQNAWDELQAAWNAAAVTEEAVAQAEVNLEEASDRHRNGLVTLSDVLDAQVKLRQAQNARTDAWAENRLKHAAYLRAVGQE